MTLKNRILNKKNVLAAISPNNRREYVLFREGPPPG